MYSGKWLLTFWGNVLTSSYPAQTTPGNPFEALAANYQTTNMYIFTAYKLKYKTSLLAIKINLKVDQKKTYKVT
jgi:hypothetical protein